MKVLIGTKNQGKIEGAARALSRYFDEFEIEGVDVKSDVSEQPVNDETYNGVKNRIKNLKTYAQDNGIRPDLYMAIESGIITVSDKWFVTNIAIIDDDNGFESCGLSPSYPVPDDLIDDVIIKNLSGVMNEIFDKDDERHNHGGGIQLLTKNQVSRIDLNELAFIMALTKYVNPEIWN